jgi:hypothetical protein
MSQADRIRNFVAENYVAPARDESRSEVTIRAGDVHRAMHLTSAMPAVCSAIGSSIFKALARVTLRERTGPANGANVYFRFGLRPPTPKEPKADATVISAERAMSDAEKPAGRVGDDLDLRGALVLVSCVKSKLPHTALARLLYTSAWFFKVREPIEGSGAPWFVLSSLYGLVAPTERIAPYDHTLNTPGVAERQAWAKKVRDKLLPEAISTGRIVIFAGVRYREFLIDSLQRQGVVVEVPMANLARGEQLAWLSERR